MMTRKIFILALIISIFSCSRSSEKEQVSEGNSKTKKTLLELNTTKEDTIKTDIDTINTNTYAKSDINETIKQGEIITRNRYNDVVSIMNYANDTLDGYFMNWEGMQKDGYYKKGKKHGYFRTYYGDRKDEKVMLTTYFRNDTLMWYAHPASDEMYIYNPKGFSSPFDSIYIKTPFVNGDIWYEGLFIKNKEVGKHIIYKRTGGIYAIADYDKSLAYFPDKKDTLSLEECGYKKIEEEKRNANKK